MSVTGLGKCINGRMEKGMYIRVWMTDEVDANDDAYAVTVMCTLWGCFSNCG